ncbi:MAG: folate family ECF transporter S component [Oscillospiraceae bacterium]|jgi:ECF transporter S component (folate family)|nr:folate family ECF transporter S component [Oscillospiraceae bacterium]
MLQFSVFSKNAEPKTTQTPLLKNSVYELKNVKSLAIIGMLLAVAAVLGAFANFSLALFGNTAKISLKFLPITLGAYLFGPVPGALIGALSDVLSFFLVPQGGAYNPGFTLNGLLVGAISGFVLYRRKPTIIRVFVCFLLTTLLVEIPLSALWLTIMYDLPFWATVTGRCITRGILLPCEVAVTFALFKSLGIGLQQLINKKAP